MSAPCCFWCFYDTLSLPRCTVNACGWVGGGEAFKSYWHNSTILDFLHEFLQSLTSACANVNYSGNKGALTAIQLKQCLLSPWQSVAEQMQPAPLSLTISHNMLICNGVSMVWNFPHSNSFFSVAQPWINNASLNESKQKAGLLGVFIWTD